MQQKGYSSQRRKIKVWWCCSVVESLPRVHYKKTKITKIKHHQEQGPPFLLEFPTNSMLEQTREHVKLKGNCHRLDLKNMDKLEQSKHTQFIVCGPSSMHMMILKTMAIITHIEENVSNMSPHLVFVTNPTQWSYYLYSSCSTLLTFSPS